MFAPINSLSLSLSLSQNHQRAVRIVITTAITARIIRLIAETMITSHRGIPYHVEHNAQGTPPHRGFSLLICSECACVREVSLPERIALGKMSGGHYLPKKVIAC